MNFKTSDREKTKNYRATATKNTLNQKMKVFSK